VFIFGYFCFCRSDSSIAFRLNSQPIMSRHIHYFGHLRAGKIALWCYLIWYAVMAWFYFDPRAALWINSAGISVVIGTALILSVMPAGGIGAMEKWTVARLFMMPFCVSSFAALIKDQGFLVVFSPSLRENLIAAGLCGLFVALAFVAKSLRRHAAP
jgi:hypothetical protein